MDFPFTLPGYPNFPLVFRLGIVKSPAILYNNKPLPRQGRNFILPLSNGIELELKLKYFKDLDVILPRIEFQNQLIRLAPPLPAYQYIFFLLPLVLVFVGGAIGGSLGAAAAYYNMYNLHDPKDSTMVKNILASLTIIAAVIGWVAIGLVIGTFIK
jgi:hypothetical protein